MPTKSARGSGAQEPPPDVEVAPDSPPESQPADAPARPRMSRGEQERLRRKLREKFH